MELLNDPAVEVGPMLDEALRCARRVGSPDLTARVLGGCLSVRGDLAQRIGAAEDYSLEPYARDIEALEEVIGGVTDLRLAVVPMSHRSQLALRRGDVEAAAQDQAMASEAVLHSGTVVEQWSMAFLAAGTRLYRGEHDEAEGLIEQAAALGRLAGDTDADQIWGNQMLFLRRQQGRPEEMIDIADAVVVAEPTGWGEWCAALALLQSEAGRMEDARRSFDRALIEHNRPDHRPWMPTAATLAHVAADLGAVEAAGALVAELEPVRGQTVGWVVLATLGPADLALGRLYLLQGRFDDASEALAASAELCERGGMRPFLAQTRLAQGEVARAQDEAAAARRFLEQALTVAEAGDFRTTIRRATAVLAALG
jgi:tetratricopeptide (TPR) repeat protein